MGVYIDETMSTDDIYILPSSSESSILIPSSATAVSSSSSNSSSPSNSSLPSNSSSSSNLSSSLGSSSSTMESSLYSSERICYLLKNEKQQYSIIKNKISSPVGSYWSIFGFPAKLKKKLVFLRELMDIQVVKIARKFSFMVQIVEQEI